MKIREMIEQKLAQEKNEFSICMIQKTLSVLRQEILNIVVPEPLPEGQLGLRSENCKRIISELISRMMASKTEIEWQFWLDFANRAFDSQPDFDIDFDEQEEILREICGVPA